MGGAALTAREALLQAGLQAPDPYPNVRKLVRVEGNRLIVGGPEFAKSPSQPPLIFDLPIAGRIYVIGRPFAINITSHNVRMRVTDGGELIGSIVGRGYLCWERAPGIATIASAQPRYTASTTGLSSSSTGCAAPKPAAPPEPPAPPAPGASRAATSS